MFSGIGAQIKGIQDTELFDCEVINTSDIDKDAMLSYAAIHNGITNELIKNYSDYPTREEMAKYLSNKNIGYNFEKSEPYNWFKLVKRKNKVLEKYYLSCILSKNLGDISKIKQLSYADLWTYSFPCFVEGTLVLTIDGYKQIEEIVSGDYVLTHTNQYKKVVKPMVNETKHIYKLDTMISESIFTTKNHPFYVRRKRNVQDSKTSKRWREFDKPIWKPIGELSTDYYVGTAINQESKLPEWNGIICKWTDGRCDRKSDILKEKFELEDFWYLIGRFIGDGWIRSGNGIIICANDEELGQIISVVENIGFNYSLSKERTVNKIHITLKEIGEYCEQFGRGAANKHLTSDILSLPIDKLKAFLDGYIGADGCFTQNKYKITSVSRELIYEIGQCVAKAYHMPFSIYFTQRPKTTVIEGRVVNQKDTYQITFSREIRQQSQAFYEDGYIWSPIRNVAEQEYDGLVYNLEVEDDNSYIVQNIIVHNCQDISVSGKQAGIKQGTRSGLLFEVERLLEFADKNKTLPKYLLLENVKNLVGKRHIHNFNEWLKKLNELGYNTYYQVINGKNCGIPQNRERVFALSIRKDIDTCDFQFPKAFDNGVRLKDVLENEVDDKYYLKAIKNYFMKHSIDCEQQGQGFRFKPHNPSKAETAFTISTKAGGRIGDNFINEKDLNDKPFFEFNTNNLKQVAQIYGTETEPNPQACRIYGKDYISPTLDSCSGGVVSGGYTNQSRSPIEGLNKTLKANANDAGVVENRKIRKLTEKECWRLMGFNDCCIEKAKQMQVASTQLYKQAGNSIITNCIKLLMEHLYKAQYDNTYVCEDESNIF